MRTLANKYLGIAMTFVAVGVCRCGDSTSSGTTGTTGAAGMTASTGATGTTGSAGGAGAAGAGGTSGSSGASGAGGTGQGDGGANDVCANDSQCQTGFRCCYPCGIPGCMNQCLFTDGGRCPLFP